MVRRLLNVSKSADVWRRWTGLKSETFLWHSVCSQRPQTETRWLMEIACIRHCCVVDVLITWAVTHQSRYRWLFVHLERPAASEPIRQHTLSRRIGKARLARRSYSWVLTVITVAAARIFTEGKFFVFSCSAWCCWRRWVSGKFLVFFLNIGKWRILVHFGCIKRITAGSETTNWANLLFILALGVQTHGYTHACQDPAPGGESSPRLGLPPQSWTGRSRGLGNTKSRHRINAN